MSMMRTFLVPAGVVALVACSACSGSGGAAFSGAGGAGAAAGAGGGGADGAAGTAKPDASADGAAGTDAGGGSAGDTGPGPGGCKKDGDCAPPTPRCDLASGSCVECLPLADNCAKGKWCATYGDGGATQCLPGCKDNADCASAAADGGSGGAAGADGGAGKLVCVDHKCIGCAKDIDCAPGFLCGSGSECVPGCNAQKGCAGSQTCCAGQCFDLQSDPGHCGDCAKVCPKPDHAKPLCVNAACKLGPCDPGFSDCNQTAADGCEADLQGDTANCGACKKLCPVPANATAACKGGGCGIGACAAGWSNCDADPSNGCETSTASDVKNCGECNKACAAPPNVVAACSSGTCGTGGCMLGYGDCNAQTSDGCEADLKADGANCGGCGKSCAAPKAQTACSGGACKVTGCDSGWGDCDANVQNGCEADVLSSVTNCGKCAQACAAPPNAAAKCAGGQCGMGACSTDFGDCDANAQNGCEANLKTDKANCGQCARACGGTEQCVNGTCNTGPCGNGIVDPGERCDGSVGLPPGGQVTCYAPATPNQCKFNFSAVPQLYCNGTCTWAGSQGCDKADADIFCKLKTGSTTSQATSFTTSTALGVPGFSCPGYGQNLGPMPEFGVGVNVWYQGSSILANHGPGTVINSVTCSP